MDRAVTVGVTGASGSCYAARLLRALGQSDVDQIHLIVSRHARVAIREELDITADGPLDLELFVGGPTNKIRIEEDHAIESRVASGSNPSLGMVIVPCSMGTLARIVHGTSDSLLTRAADVSLKERRKLLLAVRETPLSQVHLRNMLAAAEVGATIMPAMPAFYARPKTVDDIVDHFVGRILSHLGVAHDLSRRWQPRTDTS